MIKNTHNAKNMLEALLTIGLILITLTACERPPEIPLQITNISVHPDPILCQIATLHIETMSIYDESNVTIWVVLPEGVELVSGSLEWQGSLTANHSQSHELSIRVTQEGDWRLRIGAFSTFSANNGYQDTETLHLIASEDTVRVVLGKSYRITQPPEGMPAPIVPQTPPADICT